MNEPASSKGCCLNPKGWCFSSPPYHLFSTPWKIQEDVSPPPKEFATFQPAIAAIAWPHLGIGHSHIHDLMSGRSAQLVICHGNLRLNKTKSWLVVSTHLTNISQYWIISPGWGENKKYFKPPPRKRVL